VLAAQGGPPCSGKLNGYIAGLWTDVRLCPRPRIGWTGRAPAPNRSENERGA
jgi:hypothetical protein